MLCVIYRFILKDEQVDDYKKQWDIVTDYFIKHRGALGSCLHQADNGLWLAYSRWPDKATRDAAWPGEKQADQSFPSEVVAAIENMQKIKASNTDEQQYDETVMDLVMDKLHPASS